MKRIHNFRHEGVSSFTTSSKNTTKPEVTIKEVAIKPAPTSRDHHNVFKKAPELEPVFPKTEKNQKKIIQKTRENLFSRIKASTPDIIHEDPAESISRYGMTPKLTDK